MSYRAYLGRGSPRPQTRRRRPSIARRAVSRGANGRSFAPAPRQRRANAAHNLARYLAARHEAAAAAARRAGARFWRVRNARVSAAEIATRNARPRGS